MWRWAIGAGGFALCLLVGAIVVKRTRESRLLAGGGVGLSIQESIWVGKGQRLMVVNAAGQRYLLGATGGGLETLAELGPVEGSSSVDDDEDDLDAAAKPATFKDLVQSAMTGEPSAPRNRRKEIIDGLRVL